MTVPATSRDDTAVIIGASIAGLLAARVLAESVGRVVVLDRDTLPEDAVPRGGVPQSAHAHALLSRGLRALEEVLPGLTAQLEAHGALSGDPQEAFRWITDGRSMTPGRSGLCTLMISRPLLEREVRRRVMADPRISIEERVEVRALLHDGADRVTGVTGVDRDAPAGDQLRRWDAGLVVDASGRRSRASAWLSALGFAPPAEERVEVDLTYATRQYRRDPADVDGALGVIVNASPDTQRGGGLFAQEGDRWICTLAGLFGDRPPIDPDGFEAYAATLCSSLLHDVITSSVPLDEPRRFRFPASVRRRYERLARSPRGLLVTGDAVCSFDPVYGQGMTVAALEALVLRDVLRQGMDRPSLAQEFWRGCASVVDVPWQMSTGGATRLPGYRGPVDRRTRMVNTYMSTLQRAMASDPAVGTAFVRVAQLEAPPSSLVSPSVLARVVRASCRPRVEARRPVGAGVRGPTGPRPV
jgi:2-polyprenyl-6-methoxyphenol hydroxylase-like FAD-dependent oxidoreductase